ncbi:MAG: hypothetical protein COW03_02470 [Cytophagales bacterium CG12_big_fil_rev_8_21_14_0_65_40_12]|nr:MAG: hypothetical protein COW03_02470 [Cytophagales bacterium CG12_big_fil_rev_8_21_14_0_65_40_12]PIW03409.1 MAG: hypothetical protein COW40_14715 [Cytophagales bacterium CG17_big_fil_post_rev_8_21_14_2_50_40_13]
MKYPITTKTKLLPNILDADSHCIGSIYTLGSIYFNGRINGDLCAAEKIVLGPSAIINGNLEAREIIIEGTVFGNIDNCVHLILRKTAAIQSAFVHAESCQIERGAGLQILDMDISSFNAE